MAWSGGVFTRTNGTYAGAAVWQSDASAAIKIVAARHDTHDKDLADGINACLHKGGQNAATADISFGGFKLTSLGNGTLAQDAATYAQTITAAAWDAGTNTLTFTRAAGNVTVVVSGVGSAAWGGVTGTLSAQADLWARLTTLPQNSISSGITLALTDAGKHVQMTSSSDTVTIPLNSAVAFPVGTTILVVNDYSGSNSIAVTGGVTLRKAWSGATGAVTMAAYGIASLIKIGTDSWIVTGTGGFVTAIHCAFVGSGSNGFGPDVVTNGGFDADTDWTKSADWSIGSGRANYGPGGSGGSIRQDMLDINTVGNTYRMTFTIVSGTGTVYGTLTGGGGSVVGTNRTGAGTYQENLFFPVSAGNLERIQVNGSGASAVSIDNLSVVRVY